MVNKSVIYSCLGLAVLIVSFSAILIKAASEAPSLVIAAARLGISALVLAPLALALKREAMRALSPREWALILCSGLFLGLHFVTWISSLKYTSVASSVILVSINPVFVGLGARFLIGERLDRRLWLGIGVSVAGAILIGYGDIQVGGMALWGDLLALLGAMMASGYFLVGRRLRPKTDLLMYIFVVYSTAALVLLLLVFPARAEVFSYAPLTYLWLILMALGPQLLGHTMFNWALRYIPAASVAVVILGEPIGSSILAYFLLHEELTWLKLAGGALTLSGIYLAIRWDSSRP
jgi:drug/metabolite transporter (DMT)-like permease